MESFNGAVAATILYSQLAANMGPLRSGTELCGGRARIAIATSTDGARRRPNGVANGRDCSGSIVWMRKRSPPALAQISGGSVGGCGGNSPARNVKACSKILVF